jgi:glycine betaine/proline transport system permease protein
VNVSSGTQLDIGRGFEGGLAVVILAIYLDRVSSAASVHPDTGCRWAGCVAYVAISGGMPA